MLSSSGISYVVSPLAIPNSTTNHQYHKSDSSSSSSGTSCSVSPNSSSCELSPKVAVAAATPPPNNNRTSQLNEYTGSGEVAPTETNFNDNPDNIPVSDYYNDASRVSPANIQQTDLVALNSPPPQREQNSSSDLKLKPSSPDKVGS